MSGLELLYRWGKPVLLILSVGVLLLDRAYSRHIQSRHPETWTSLRASTGTWYQSVTKSLTLQRFLWTSGYRQLEDPELNRLAGWAKAAGAVYLGYFFLLIAVLMTRR